MTVLVKIQFLAALVLGVVILCAKPLGSYIADVMEGRPTLALRWGGPFERLLSLLWGVDARHDMTWSQFPIALLVFNLFGALVIYALQRLQLWLPLNPQKM